MKLPTDADAVELARLDPSFAVCLWTGNIQAGVHEQFQDHLSKHDDAYGELHRGIGKTTQMSCRIAWEIGHNTDIRIKYVQQNDDEAKKTVRAVRDLLMTPEYQATFPNVIPDDDLWGAEAFSVRRTRYSRDATMEGVGIFGRAGGRADILVSDDICDMRNAVQQPAMREQTKHFWVNNWLPMLDVSAKRRPRVWKVGTPYHIADITADWRRKHAEDGSLLRLPVEGYKSPWADVFTEELLRNIEKAVGLIAFNRAYRLQPISADMLVFAPAWLDAGLYESMPEWDRQNSRVIAIFDWAFTDNRSGVKKTSPDYSVCLIARVTTRGDVWLLRMIRVRDTFPGFLNTAINACVELGVTCGWGENNGPQKGLVQTANDTAPFPIMGIERTTDKMVRAVAAQAFVQSGRFHIPGRRDGGTVRPMPEFESLYDEMTTFPAAEHDDTVDTALDMIEKARDTTGLVGAITNVQSDRPKMWRLYGKG